MNLFPSLEGEYTNESSIENLTCVQEEMTKVDDDILLRRCYSNVLIVCHIYNMYGWFMNFP